MDHIEFTQEISKGERGMGLYHIGNDLMNPK
jgi:hypothetical protein